MVAADQLLKGGASAGGCARAGEVGGPTRQSPVRSRRKRSPASGMSGSHTGFGSVCDEPERGGFGCNPDHGTSHLAISEECVVTHTGPRDHGLLYSRHEERVNRND